MAFECETGAAGRTSLDKSGAQPANGASLPESPNMSVLLRVGCSDHESAVELERLLSSNQITHSPVQSSSTSPAFGMDFGLVISHMHEIMIVLETFVVGGTLAHWMLEATKKRQHKPQAVDPKSSPDIIIVSVNQTNIVIGTGATPETIEKAIVSASASRGG
jgi:hypothetical protein